MGLEARGRCRVRLITVNAGHRRIDNEPFEATLPDNRINHLTSAHATSDNPLGEAVPPHGEKVDLIKERLGMRGLRIALGLIGVFGLTATAVAAESGFYVGGGVGQYNAQVEIR